MTLFSVEHYHTYYNMFAFPRLFPGYFSWRNSTKGSWFVQAICKVFNEHGTRKEMMSLMTRVNHMVAFEFESNASKEFMNRKKQVPSIMTMLTKELYFSPKSG